ncbi:MAG: biotin/lipoyl-containing protein, partial [Planctomycetota bacterium]
MSQVAVEVPNVGESITEVQIGQWLKSVGDYVQAGEDLVEIETEKASVQIPSPSAGVLTAITKDSEEFANVGESIAMIDPNAEATSPPASPASESPASSEKPSPPAPTKSSQPAPSSSPAGQSSFVMPAARRLLDQHGLQADQVPATGPGGRLLKEDVQHFIESGAATPAPAPPPAVAPPAPTSMMPPSVPATSTPISGTLMSDVSPHRSEEVKPMSMLRRTIANRLVEAQQTAALLTTFNEIDMAPVMAVRSQYKDAFAEKHGVKLGFMSFFTKASVEALRKFPL